MTATLSHAGVSDVPFLPPDDARPPDRLGEVPSLPPWAATVADLAGGLSVARVRGQREPGLVRHLLAARVGFYFPQQLVCRRYPDGRRKQWHRAFLPGLLFVAGGDDGKDAARNYGLLYSDRFYGFVGLLSHPATQRQLCGELLTMERMLGIDPTLTASERPAVGQRVRVTAGAFQGLVGYAESLNKRCLFTVRLPTLGRSVPVEIPAEYLERYDPEAPADPAQ